MPKSNKQIIYEACNKIETGQALLIASDEGKQERILALLLFAEVEL